MANKKKYEDAKMAAWYADPKALKVLDTLRTKEQKKGEKEISRSSYINSLLIKLGLEKGIIEPPKPKPEPIQEIATPDINLIVEEVVKALKKQGTGSESKTKRTVVG